MELEKIGLESLHAAILNGCHHLIQQREAMNAINVFPVADGDTGDNMSATAMAILQESSPQSTLQGTLQSIANAALLGARGNSGMIFSQFFNGLAENASSQPQLNNFEFSQLIKLASQSVRASILHPVEGTILTLIEVWAKELDRLTTSASCLKALVNQALPAAQKALAETTKTLKALEKAQVVDAGALGFYHFIEGLTVYLQEPVTLPAIPVLESLILDHHELPAGDEPPSHRYCTEGRIDGKAIDRQMLAQELEVFGDCVVISGNQEGCRFHLHCNDPAAVFTLAKGKGLIHQPKVDDMLRQFEVVHSKKHRIALVSDSSADLSQALLDRYQIHLLPLNMHLDGHHLLNRYGMDPNLFYQSLGELKTYPTTSFPPPAVMEQKFASFASHYEDVLVISIAQVLSGTHDAIQQAAAKFSHIHVIDSRQIAAGQGLLVYYAAQLIEQGLSLEAIKEAIEQKIPKIKLYVLIDQFDSMIRSGRISKLGGKLAQLAHVKPIISLDEKGKGIIKDKAFSYNKGLVKLIQLMDQFRQGQKIEAYSIIHAGIESKAMDFAKLTTEAFDQEPLFIEPVSTAIGLHAGQGCIALAMMLAD